MQIAFYFPLKDQLSALISLPGYRQLLLHEHRRSRTDNTMSDVYDTPRWQKIAGEPTPTLTRIVIHTCADGVPVYGRKEILSATPIQQLILSLPPWLRYQAKYMLVQMLIPANVKGPAAKKYYDWAAIEINHLYREGINGVRVLIYGDTLDTPGRREIMNMQSVTAFYPCPHCLHTWQPGLRGQIYGGYRRFLELGSRWRQREFTFRDNRYMFRDVETREAPIARTDSNVSVMVSLAQETRPVCGHKGPRFMHKWLGTDWEGSACDGMHDKKIFSDMTLKGLVGYGPNGMYKSWNKDTQHRQDCRAFGIHPEFANNPDSLPPWRLSREGVEIMDKRVCSMWWPHYIDRLCRKGHSFWTHPDRSWKAVHKHYVLMVILPTCLHDFVPAVHAALLMLVNALRHLDGEVVSINEAKRRGVEPGSTLIVKRKIAGIFIWISAH